jgi:hypothetical protein
MEKANLKRIDFQKATLKTDCINGAMWKLKEGDWVFAFRHFCFAFTAYPTIAIRTLNTYLVLILLILGPIGILLAKLVMINRK